ncbi:DUF3413 domain-containing protein [Actinomadura keratinilytica]
MLFSRWSWKNYLRSLERQKWLKAWGSFVCTFIFAPFSLCQPWADAAIYRPITMQITSAVSVR